MEPPTFSIEWLHLVGYLEWLLFTSYLEPLKYFAFFIKKFAGGGGSKNTLIFSLYCMARQHPAQNASTQRHGQTAPLRFERA